VREDVASADPEQLVDTALGRADDRASGAMELYFSHSYCDVSIHSYFVNELAGCGFQLLADQKSPVWCVAKLERYIAELPGFLSIIPRYGCQRRSSCWAFDDPPSLRQHVSPLHPFVLDEVERLNRIHGTTLAARSGRGHDLEKLCRR
jgi:hypothetical protein